ncbi:stonustoxin subunit beta-like [Aulostomus maculatus]
MTSRAPSDILTMSALGQPFTIGMLYDARKSLLVPGFTLWDETTLTQHTTVSPQRNSQFSITASDTIESKSSMLDIDASLKASFLGGLIELEGSAKYLNDQKRYKNQSRVTFKYKATTHFKQLSMTSLGTLDTHQTEVIEKGLATHVVTGILYGANAFFVFDSEKLEESDVQKIEGSMQALIKKIPSFDVEGKVDIKLTDEEKALTKKFSCKFYGDLLLESNPATFEEAVKTFVDLPKLLGGSGENAAPVHVWLMPLKTLDSKAAELMSDLSVGIVRKAQDAIEDGREMEMRCNDALADSVADHFPEIRKTVGTFQKLCNYYTSFLQQTMAKKIPAIREGKEDESSLAKLFEDRETSPFSHEKLSLWMDNKEREITVMWSCIEMMKGADTRIVQNKSELDRVVLDPEVHHVLCYVFTSLETTDPYVDEMDKYLDSLQLTRNTEEPWYFSEVVLADMRAKAKAFRDIAMGLKGSTSVRVLIAAIANEKHTGATIYHYKEGTLVTDDFSRPEVPQVETISDKSALIWYACSLKLDPATVNNKLTLSDDNSKATYGAQQSYPDLPNRFDTCPQVLGTEGLTGRCYWEIEWSELFDGDVAVGVTYKQIQRKGDGTECFLGGNAISWCFGYYAPTPEIFAGHDNQWWHGTFPPTGLKHIGVYLDWLAGSLSFYKVSGNSLTHLYTYYARFIEPVYPGCYMKNQSSYVCFCPVQ